MTTINTSGTISQDGTGLSYTTNNGGTPITIDSNNFLTIINSNPTQVLKVLFDTDITITSNNFYIVCGSDNIQIGDTSLNPINGSRPIITINTGADYPGFIQNGTVSVNAKNNIYVFNLDVRSSSNLAAGGGWIGQRYFGSLGNAPVSGQLRNYIVNCSSTGDITVNSSGGIVGSDSGSIGVVVGIIDVILYITGCWSTGIIGGSGTGCIVGSGAGANGGNVTCQYCWSTNAINSNAGGIFGATAGFNAGAAYAINCYSEGQIGGNGAGGIFGSSANGTATNCYSKGPIHGNNAGGIIGNNAGSNASITNCYSLGSSSITQARGIVGTNYGGTAPTNCYIANGIGNWSDTDANNQLTGVPATFHGVGTTWVSTASNTSYELFNMGYTPYAFVNITTSPTPDLKRTYTQTVTAGGEPSSRGINTSSVPPPVYSILNRSAIPGSMTINSSTGAITATSATPKGTYNIVVRNTGSYNVTTFELTVASPPTPDSNICFPAGTPILTDQGNIPIEKINPKVHTIRNKKIEGIVRTKLMDNYLVCFEKNSLGPNVPCERTVMSGNHKVVVGGQMKMAREILNARSMSFGRKTNSTAIHPIAYDGQPMYNVLMEDYNVILVNNMVCETLDPDNKMADLHAHLKYMSHERQQMLVSKFNGISEGNPSKGAPVAQGNPSKNTTLKMKFR